jgi:hypothetical protein
MRSAPRLFLLAIVSLVSIATVIAQDDTTLVDVDENSTSIRRRPNGEWMVGVQSATYSFEPEVNGEPYPSANASDSRTFFGVGYGGHVPIVNVGTYGTLWFVPAVNTWLSIGSTTGSDGYSETSMGFEVAVPVHATIAYGGLRRKSMAWGIEGGLGANVGFRTRTTWETSVWSIAPSALVDLTYAPKNIFRLRFLADLLPASIAEFETYRTWSLQFVVGF